MASVRINKNYEKYNLWQDKSNNSIAYIAPLVREAFIRCEELNKAIIGFIGNLTTIETTDLKRLYEQQPELLGTVIYDKEVYSNLLAMISSD
jgi:hypothetical protein